MNRPVPENYVWSTVKNKVLNLIQQNEFSLSSWKKSSLPVVEINIHKKNNTKIWFFKISAQFLALIFDVLITNKWFGMKLKNIVFD